MKVIYHIYHKILCVPNFFSLKCQISPTHLTTLRLNDTPTGGAMEKGIFFKFKEKLHSTIFYSIVTDTLAANTYYRK